MYVAEIGQTDPGSNSAEFAFFVAGPRSQSTIQGPYFFLRGNNFTKFPEKGMVGLFAGKVTSPVGDDGKIVLFSHTDVDIRTGEDQSPNGNKLMVKTNGNVGIGTNTPLSKLSIKGYMESQEVQVKATVADYVFSSEYQMMSLEELENYILINKLLPRIQTQNDVDENRGLVKLGELSVSLMEKVEELTLHIIELNKRLKVLEAENPELRESKN